MSPFFLRGSPVILATESSCLQQDSFLNRTMSTTWGVWPCFFQATLKQWKVNSCVQGEVSYQGDLLLDGCPWVDFFSVSIPETRRICLEVSVVPYGAPSMRGLLLIFWMIRFSQVWSSSLSILTCGGFYDRILDHYNHMWNCSNTLVILGQVNPELCGGELEIQGGDYFLLWSGDVFIGSDDV